MRYLSRWLIVSLFCLVSLSALAITSPLTMLQTASDQMITQLQQNKGQLKADPSIIHRIVNQTILPHIDVDAMCRAVLGRTVWTSATLQQQAAFKQQFTTMVINTYSSALSSYNNETVKFFPIRGDTSGQSQVQVKSQIMQPDGPPIPVNYLLNWQNNDWKVYDFSVEGVSMVNSFRSQFASDLAQPNGLDNLIQKMAQHNANASNSAS